GDLDLQPLGKRLHDENADAVQSALDLVAPAAKLPAGVEHGHHYFDAGLPNFRHDIDGNPAAVVRDRDAVVLVDGDVDPMAVAGERLIDAVVHDFKSQVV